MRLSHLEQLQYFEDTAEGHPEWYPATLIRVMDGESLNSIAQGYACFGVVLREWIKRDDDREAAYQEALEKKREMFAEALLDRTASAALATIQDAQTASGDWQDVALWSGPMLAAADAAEFGPDGRPYKIKMDAGKHADRLGRMLGMDKSGQTNVNVVSLVNILTRLPKAGQINGDVEDATYPAPAQVAQKEADAGETVGAATPHGNLLLDKSPRQSAPVPAYQDI